MLQLLHFYVLQFAEWILLSSGVHLISWSLWCAHMNRLEHISHTVKSSAHSTIESFHWYTVNSGKHCCHIFLGTHYCISLSSASLVLIEGKKVYLFCIILYILCDLFALAFSYIFMCFFHELLVCGKPPDIPLGFNTVIVIFKLFF